MKGLTPKTILGPDWEGPKSLWVRICTHPPTPLGLDIDPTPSHLGFGQGRTQTQTQTPLVSDPYANLTHIGFGLERTQTQPFWVRTRKDPNPTGSSHGPSPQPSWVRTGKDPHLNSFWVQTLSPNPTHLGPDSKPNPNPFGFGQ